jgi:hypothetical protein
MPVGLAQHAQLTCTPIFVAVLEKNNLLAHKSA